MSMRASPASFLTPAKPVLRRIVLNFPSGVYDRARPGVGLTSRLAALGLLDTLEWAAWRETIVEVYEHGGWYHTYDNQGETLVTANDAAPLSAYARAFFARWSDCRFERDVRPTLAQWDELVAAGAGIAARYAEIDARIAGAADGEGDVPDAAELVNC
jgi:hypothetical protein